MNKVVKYLLCILFSILSINFIVSASSCFSSISQYLIPAEIIKNPTNEEVVSSGKDLESIIEDSTAELKEAHGEDYPALGVMYYRTVAHYSSVSNVQNFIFSLICGFALGNIIFFIFVVKFKSYKLIVCLILVLFVTAFFFALSDVLTYVANAEKVKFGLSEIFWNMEITAIHYTIACLVLAGIHKVYTVYVEIQNS